MSEINVLLYDIRRIADKANYLGDEKLCDDLLATVDDLEEEIKEWFIGLPVDADGAVIHPGDTLIVKDGGYGVEGVQLFLASNGLWAIAGRRPDEYVHHKPRMIEDVLCEMLDRHSDGIGLREFNRDFLKFVGHYADEIRDLMGVQE